MNLSRSDSIGSTSGRKYLAPTLSDPAARTEKERATNTKKKTNRPPGKLKIHHREPKLNHFFSVSLNKTTPHVNEIESRMPREVFNNKTTLPKASNALNEIKDWWTEQLNYASSSDED